MKCVRLGLLGVLFIPFLSLSVQAQSAMQRLPLDKYMSSLDQSGIRFHTCEGSTSTQLTVFDPSTGYEDTVYLKQTAYKNDLGLRIEILDHEEYPLNTAMRHTALASLDPIFGNNDEKNLHDWISDIYGAVIHINDQFFLLKDDDFGDIEVPEQIQTFSFGSHKYITFSSTAYKSTGDKRTQKLLFLVDVTNPAKIKVASASGDKAAYYCLGDFNKDGQIDLAFLDNITDQYKLKSKSKITAYYRVGCLSLGSQNFHVQLNQNGEPASIIISEQVDGTFQEEDRSHWFGDSIK